MDVVTMAVLAGAGALAGAAMAVFGVMYWLDKHWRGWWR